MSPSYRSQASKISALLLALTLVVFASGCKKKVASSPPPPPPRDIAPPPPSVSQPVINSFTAEPSTIDRGQSSTLRWSISNATDMTIDQGVGAVQSQGQRSVSPGSTSTYTLVANGP